MDPLTALVFSMVVAHLIVRNAWRAGAGQARVEARRAREAIQADLRRRRTETARRIERRLARARATGPRAALWWVWAGMATARTLRRAVRQGRRPAERNPRAIRATTGPFRRIWEAAWRAAAWTAREGRRQWEESAAGPGGAAGARPKDVPVGVCERCGAVTAKTALALAPTPSGRMAPMCASCRAATPSRPTGPAGPPGDGGGDVADGGGDVADAEVVEPAPPALPAPTPAVGCVNCGQPLTAFSCTNLDCPLCPGYIAPRNGKALPQDPATQVRLPVRYCPECSAQLVPPTWYAVNATNADVCLFCTRANHGEGQTRKRADAELAAIGEPLGSRGQPVALDPEMRAGLAREANRIAAEAAREGSLLDDIAAGEQERALREQNLAGLYPEQYEIPPSVEADIEGARPEGLSREQGGTWDRAERLAAACGLRLQDLIPQTRRRVLARAAAYAADPQAYEAELAQWRDLYGANPEIIRAPQPAPTDPAPTGGAALAGDNPTGEDMTCVTGEVHTQAAWHAQAAAITASLQQITTSAENVLRCLDAKQAGRTHMAQVKAWSDEVSTCMQHGQEVLGSVNARQDPYVGAVQAAGGSGEVAAPSYYDEM